MKVKKIKVAQGDKCSVEIEAELSADDNAADCLNELLEHVNTELEKVKLNAIRKKRSPSKDQPGQEQLPGMDEEPNPSDEDPFQDSPPCDESDEPQEDESGDVEPAEEMPPEPGDEQPLPDPEPELSDDQPMDDIPARP